MPYPEAEALESLIMDVGECAERVHKIDILMSSLKDDKLKHYYLEEYHQVVDLYLILCEMLEQELQKAIKFEKENQLPITLAYHQILKDIRLTLKTLSDYIT